MNGIATVRPLDVAAGFQEMDRTRVVHPASSAWKCSSTDGPSVNLDIDRCASVQTGEMFWFRLKRFSGS